MHIILIILLLHTYLKLPDEEVIASWNNPTQSDSSWQATIQMAWQISAHLVFQLSVRYSTYIHNYTYMPTFTYVCIYTYIHAHIYVCILYF